MFPSIPEALSTSSFFSRHRNAETQCQVHRWYVVLIKVHAQVTSLINIAKRGYQETQSQEEHDQHLQIRRRQQHSAEQRCQQLQTRRTRHKSVEKFLTDLKATLERCHCIVFADKTKMFEHCLSKCT
jgi:hypothetical protein